MSIQETNAALDIICWERDFATDIPIIDHHHRQLIKLINSFAQQYACGLELEAFQRSVDSIVDYAIYHFETEKNWWIEALESDEWLTQQQHSHSEFIDKVLTMKFHISQSSSLSGADDLLHFLVRWLITHILYDDKRLTFMLFEFRKGQPLNRAKLLSYEIMSDQIPYIIKNILGMYQRLFKHTIYLQPAPYCNHINRESTSLSKQSNELELPIHDSDLHTNEESSNQVNSNNLKESLLYSEDISCEAKKSINRTLLLNNKQDIRLLISDFAADFMAAPPEEFDAVINRVLQKSGEYMEADRTYIFLINDNDKYMSNTHEWCATGISPEINNLQDMPANLVNWWWQQLNTVGYVLITNIHNMPPEAQAEYAILEAQNVKSVCVYPLFMNGKIIGFLGNDAVQKERHWSSDVLQFLALMSDLLSIALEHRHVRKQKKKVLNRLERAEQQAHLGHWIYNLETDKTTWSPEVFRIFEWPPSNTAPSYDTYLKIVHPEDRNKVNEAFQKAKSECADLNIEYRICLAPEQEKHLIVSGQFELGPNGKPALIEGTVQDISEKVEQQELLHQLAYQDTLTSLKNQRALVDELRREMAYCKQHDCHLVLASLDIDNFREVNNSYGKTVGDSLLIAVSQRILNAAGKSAIVARIDGDEFAILLPRLSLDNQAYSLFSQVLYAINEPLNLLDNDIKVTASMGTTTYPQAQDISAEHILRQARQALFTAKVQGKNKQQQYDIEQEKSTRKWNSKLYKIKSALLNKEFILYYQPKVNMRKGSVIGAEALIRWQKPSGEMIPPDSFLPTIKDHSLEIELGDWVIDTALAQGESWHKQGLLLEVSINVTSLQILEDAFLSKLKAALKTHPLIPPEFVQIEILESSALNDLDKVSRTMHECRKLGVKFALDDFGTGFSSLSYLKYLPANILKIDQSFVRNMLDDSDDLSIISGIVGMSQAFGLDVLAEGIETEEHGDLLLRLGCELGQGYGIARPMKAKDLTQWVYQWKASNDWKEHQPVETHNLPLLHAEVEHRHWLNQLEQWLQGEVDSLPILQAKHCKVGRWIENEGRERFKNHPIFIKLIHSHERLHKVGDSLVNAHNRGDNSSVNSNLAIARECRDRVIESLRKLEKIYVNYK